jgi:hypothetical protein
MPLYRPCRRDEEPALLDGNRTFVSCGRARLASDILATFITDPIFPTPEASAPYIARQVVASLAYQLAAAS